MSCMLLCLSEKNSLTNLFAQHSAHISLSHRTIYLHKRNNCQLYLLLLEQIITMGHTEECPWWIAAVEDIKYFIVEND